MAARPVRTSASHALIAGTVGAVAAGTVFDGSKWHGLSEKLLIPWRMVVHNRGRRERRCACYGIIRIPEVGGLLPAALAATATASGMQRWGRRRVESFATPCAHRRAKQPDHNFVTSRYTSTARVPCREHR